MTVPGASAQARGVLPLDAMRTQRPSSIHLSLEVYPRCKNPLHRHVPMFHRRLDRGTVSAWQPRCFRTGWEEEGCRLWFFTSPRCSAATPILSDSPDVANCSKRMPPTMDDLDHCWSRFSPRALQLLNGNNILTLDVCIRPHLDGSYLSLAVSVDGVLEEHKLLRNAAASVAALRRCITY